MGSKSGSIFKYQIIKAKKYTSNLKDLIAEEINKGFHFSISSDSEDLIRLAGNSKDWVKAIVKQKQLILEINDDFFIEDSIIEQILTTLWHNLMDFCDLNFIDFHLSDNIHSVLVNRRNKLEFHDIVKHKGPYLGMIYKPSHFLSLEARIEIAEKFAQMGGSFIKEDETYFVNNQEMLSTAEVIQKAMTKINRNMRYVPNITAKIYDPIFLSDLVKKGINISMVNYLVSSLPTLQKVFSNYESKLLLWGHRVGYSTCKDFISMRVIAKLAYYANLCLVHVGTPYLSNINEVKEKEEIVHFLNNVKPKVIPIFTKISPEIIKQLIKLYGQDIILMVSGSTKTNGTLDWKKIKKILSKIKEERLND